MVSTVELSSYFKGRANDKVLLVDSDIISDISKGGESVKTEQKLLAENYILVFALPSIMEVGFGPDGKAHEDEIRMYIDMYCSKSAFKGDIHASEFEYKVIAKESEYRGKWIGVSPDSHNWFAAKKLLIHFMNTRGTLPRNAKKYQVDALLSCVAWNINAFIWTNDVNDHLMISYFMNLMNHYSSPASKNEIAKRMPPIFNIETLNMILNGENVNIYREMKKKTDSEDILEILDIAIANYTKA